MNPLLTCIVVTLLGPSPITRLCAAEVESSPDPATKIEVVATASDVLAALRATGPEMAPSAIVTNGVTWIFCPGSGVEVSLKKEIGAVIAAKHSTANAMESQAEWRKLHLFTARDFPNPESVVSLLEEECSAKVKASLPARCPPQWAYPDEKRMSIYETGAGNAHNRIDPNQKEAVFWPARATSYFGQMLEGDPPGDAPPDSIMFPAAAALLHAANGVWSQDRDALRKATAACRLPALKARLARRLNDEQLTAAALKDLKDTAKTAEDYLLLTATAWRNRDVHTAAAWLEKAAPHLPEGDADATLAAALNLLLWDQQPVSADLKARAISALERLHSTPFHFRGKILWSTLAQAMGELELAQRLTATDPPRLPQTSRNRTVARTPPDTTQSVGQQAMASILGKSVLAPDWLEQEGIPALAKSRSFEEAEIFWRLLPLLKCPPAQFPEQLRIAASAEIRAFETDAIIEITRKRAPGQLPDAAGMLKRPNRGVREVVPKLLAEGGSPALTSWVRKWVGPVPTADVWNHPALSASRQPEARRFLAGLLNEPDSSLEDFVTYLQLGKAIRIANESEATPRVHLTPQFQNAAKLTGSQLETLLEAAGMFDDLPGFRLNWGSGLLMEWARKLAENNQIEGGLIAFAEELKNRRNSTFGGRLTAAVFADWARVATASGSQPQVCEVLTTSLPALRALPLRVQEEYLQFSQWPHQVRYHGGETLIHFLDEVEAGIARENATDLHSLTDAKLAATLVHRKATRFHKTIQPLLLWNRDATWILLDRLSKSSVISRKDRESLAYDVRVALDDVVISRFNLEEGTEVVECLLDLFASPRSWSPGKEQVATLLAKYIQGMDEWIKFVEKHPHKQAPASKLLSGMFAKLYLSGLEAHAGVLLPSAIKLPLAIPDTSTNMSPMLTSEAWDNRHAFLEKLPKKHHQRLAAEILIAAAFDSPEMAKSKTPRSTRLKALDRRLKGLKCPVQWKIAVKASLEAEQKAK